MTTPAMTERQLLDSICAAAKELGWLQHHDRPALTAHGWRTPVQGDVGYPDIVLTKGGKLACWELKGAHGKVAPAQQAWLDALALVPGVDVRVVRPADLESCYKYLAGIEEDM